MFINSKSRSWQCQANNPLQPPIFVPLLALMLHPQSVPRALHISLNPLSPYLLATNLFFHKLTTEQIDPPPSPCQVFRSKDYNALLYALGQLFNKVEATKPQVNQVMTA